jgi:hypothetical protein
MAARKMKNLIYIILLISIFSNAQRTEPLAYPDAIGGGAYTVGGSGGTVYHVTNLTDDGLNGSFRYGMLLTVPRIIVFDVSGIINLTSILELILENSDVTIAGQTAPQGGITITGKPVQFGGGYGRAQQPCNNVIIRYVRFRNASLTTVNAGSFITTGGINSTYRIKTVGTTNFTLIGASSNTVGASFTATGAGTGTGTAYKGDVYLENGVLLKGIVGLILDHCSFSFCNDQGISGGPTYGNFTDISISKCIFSENGTGLILGSNSNLCGDVSTINNLFVHQGHRTPNIQGNLQFDIINNVCFNWGSRLVNINGTHNSGVNYIGNYLRRGANSGTVGADNQVQSPAVPVIYTANNYHSTFHTTPILDDQDLWTVFPDNNNTPLGSGYFTQTQYPLIGESFTIKTAAQTYTDVLADVGTNKYLNADGTVGTYIDSYDTTRIDDVTNSVSRNPFNNQWVQPTLPNNTRTGYYNVAKSSDVPETWYDAKGLTTETSSTVLPSGYTVIEEFLNSVDTVTIVGSIPVITLTGASTINLNNGDTYTELGATATDVEDGNLTGVIATTGTVNTAVDGTYTINYNVTDSNSNNAVQATRTIIVTTASGNINYTLSDRQKRTSKRIIKNKLIRI